MNVEEKQNFTVGMRNGEVKMRRERDYWTEEERNRVRTLFAIGIPVNEIAIELERSENAVYQQILQMDLYARSPENTRKRRPKPMEPVCLCSVCSCDCSLCPLYKSDPALQEG